MEPYQFVSGEQPVLVSIPHGGVYVPEAIRRGFSDAAQLLPDTDWHLDRLYGWARGLGVSLIVATHSRYVIDLNRPPSDTPLYAGPTTGLCPTVLFDGRLLYRSGHEPDAAEQSCRLEGYWRPYHEQVAQELQRLHHQHGHAVLFDAHSIRSHVPRLFDGRLPDFNIGTNDGASASPDLAQRVQATCEAASPFTTVVNGRFKGGYITRHYGQPASGIHAVQLELAQRTYMDEALPFTYRDDLAKRVKQVLQQVVKALIV